MDETNATAQEVRGKLKAMESANKDDKAGSSEARIRQNMQVTLAKKFMDLMSECVVNPPKLHFLKPQSVATAAVGSVLLGLMRCAGTHRCRKRPRPSANPLPLA